MCIIIIKSFHPQASITAQSMRNPSDSKGKSPGLSTELVKSRRKRNPRKRYLIFYTLSDKRLLILLFYFRRRRITVESERLRVRIIRAIATAATTMEMMTMTMIRKKRTKNLAAWHHPTMLFKSKIWRYQWLRLLLAMHANKIN